MNDYPWIGVERWKNGEIRTNLALPFFVLLGFSALLLVLSVPLVVAEWPRLLRYLDAWVVTDLATFDSRLLLFALPLGWLLTLRPLYRVWARWRRYRNVALTLDPYPGSVGGQVGGYLTVPLRWVGTRQPDVRLNCISVSVSGSGKNRSRSEKVRWRRRAAAHVEPAGPDGTRIEFVVDVEAGLPTSDVEQRAPYTYWAVRVQLPGSGFDQTFEIPVFVTGRAERSRLRPPGGGDRAPERSVADVASTVADVRETETGFAIDFPPGRSGAMGTVLAIVGLGMAAAAGFMWFQSYLEIADGKSQYFPLLVSTVIALGFSLFAVPLFLGGLFIRTNRLMLILDRDWLMVERRAFGRRFQNLIGSDDIRAIDKTVTAQSGQGASADVFYAIKLQTGQGRTITIADGIPGQEDADALLGFLRGRIALPPGEPARARERLPLPRWAGHAIAAGKLLSLLLVLVTLAAFVTDFVKLD